jgi:hypothetical protein
VFWESYGMVTASRGRLPVILVLAGGLALAACSSLPGPGAGAPMLGPIAASKMKGAPVKGDNARFAFAKVTGGPGDLITTFNDSIKSDAKARKLNVVPEDDPNLTYRVRGYVSAVGGLTGTVLVYVLDVLDSRGVRIHRISGQELGLPTAGDPWAGIKDAIVKDAAQRAIDDLVAWVNAI